MELLVPHHPREFAMQVGDPAPAFDALTHTGARLTLQSMLDEQKRVLLWFYPRASTGG